MKILFVTLQLYINTNSITLTPCFLFSVLQDETAGRDGDLYIRSVSFSPDGKYLATGAEDRRIRVIYICFLSIFFFFFLI